MKIAFTTNNSTINDEKIDTNVDYNKLDSGANYAQVNETNR